MDKKLDNWWEHVTYTDAKRCIRENIQSLARDYIAIGFYLRRVRDEKQFQEDRYTSIHEFAYAEFGMRKSTVNHCIRINAEFSEGGNSPIIDARYKEFGKTQLQELLYVPEEKRDEVTPDMTVAEIREIHKPDRLDDEPVESEGQRLDDEPEQKEPDSERLNDEPGQCEGQRLDDEPEGNGKSGRKKPEVDSSKNESAAESETVPVIEAAEPVHFTAGPITAGNSYGSMFSESVNQYLSTVYQSESKECRVYIGWRMYKVLKRPKVTAFYDDIGKFMFDVENERLEQEYRAMLKDKEAGTFPEVLEVSTLLEGQDGKDQGDISGNAEDIPDPDLDVADAVYDEGPDHINVRALLDKRRKELNEWEDIFELDGDAVIPVGIKELRVIVQALELLAEHQESQEEIETGDKTQEQPSLPALKNNEQRKEWLRKYQEWGLWYEDGNIGAKYYRYRFENGADLIVEEYQDHSEYAGDYTSSYFHLVGGPKAVQKDCISKWQRNERYNRFPNSEGELVEFLKFVQKKEGENHVS